MIELAWGASSHTGHVRSRNEDAFRSGPSIWAVADGMGGHAMGDLAATMAIDALPTGPCPDRGELFALIRAANEAIGALAAADGAQMGTTLCGVADTRDGALLVFNVGDSRVYRISEGGALSQVTIDHSVVQELIDRGELDTDDAASHPDRNVVTRSLGMAGHLEIDWWTISPTRGDKFVICSDGLPKELSDGAINSILAIGSDPHETAGALVGAALASGGRDNVTVVVLEVVQTVDDMGGDARTDLGLVVPTTEIPT